MSEHNHVEILRVEHASKEYGTVKALKDGCITLHSGQIHALVGVNGAGKSTLSRIISGHIARTNGNMFYKGQQVHFNNPRDAMRSGISLVMQETCIAPGMTVLENLCLPDFGKSQKLDWKALKIKAERVLEELGQSAHLPLMQCAGELSIAQHQIIEIGRALLQDSDIIIFDEPTASFSPQEVDRLFNIMRMLRQRGKSMVFVSHRLEEIFEITDCITIMRDGKSIANNLPTASLTPNQLIQEMVGRDIQNLYDRAHANSARPTQEPILVVSHLRSGRFVRDVSFKVHAGEILGLAGLVGAGRSETLETLFGLRQKDAGSIRLHGKEVHFKSPHEAIKNNIGFIGEDRRHQGIIPDFTVYENLLLAHLGADKDFRLNYRKHTQNIEALLDELDMPEHILIAPMLGLSGGQQQKIILARWLLLAPKVLFLDEPTRGVDIGTRNTIYQIIRKIAAKGIAVVMVSSDFEEVLGLSDRIVVLSDGVSVVDTESAVMNPKILTMFSAPRSSAQGIHQVLQVAQKATGGAAYWLQVEESHVFCFDLDNPNQLALGFDQQTFPTIEQSAISHALHAIDETGTVHFDHALQTVFFAIANQSGHNFGYIGITCPANITLPDITQLATTLQAALRQQDTGQLNISARHKEYAL
jgi:ABC-type sugar transport system ATPase subunit